MEFVAAVTLRAKRRLNLTQLFSIAEFAATCGSPGRIFLDATFTVDARNMPDAAARAIGRITERVAGDVIAISVLTILEADRRLEAERKPGRPWPAKSDEARVDA
jgi:hypothetical protein